MITYTEVADRTGTEIPAHLIDQTEIPMAAQFARQGDVLVMRHVAAPLGTGIPLTGTGHKVVAGEADRNSHILNGDGTFHPGRYRSEWDYGLMVVPEDGCAVLTHTSEHGSIGFGCGTWRVWAQVSFEIEIRRAAD